MDKNLPEVRVGEIWADNDSRHPGRELKVLEVINPQGAAEPYAVCEVTLNVRTPSQAGKTVAILRRRFKPTSNGYRKVQDA